MLSYYRYTNLPCNFLLSTLEYTQKFLFNFSFEQNLFIIINYIQIDIIIQKPQVSEFYFVFKFRTSVIEDNLKTLRHDYKLEYHMNQVYINCKIHLDHVSFQTKKKRIKIGAFVQVITAVFSKSSG